MDKKERKKEKEYLWILYKLWIKFFLEINKLKLIFFSQKRYFEISSQIKEINKDTLMKFLSKY